MAEFEGPGFDSGSAPHDLIVLSSQEVGCGGVQVHKVSWTAILLAAPLLYFHLFIFISTFIDVLLNRWPVLQAVALDLVVFLAVGK